jgi:putative phosphoribosyl transferase
MRFRDRAAAGRMLLERLSTMELSDPVVLALPRGGIPVAAEIATALGATFDVFVARKVGAPGYEELGIGAVAEDSDDVVVTDIAWQLGIDRSGVQALAQRARAELRRQVDAYRQGRELPSLIGRDIIVVDDGLATGVTAEAALRALREHQPRRLILAVPVCARQTLPRLAELADEVICVSTPINFVSVGHWYDDFRQTTDDEVVELLVRGRTRAEAPQPVGHASTGLVRRPPRPGGLTADRIPTPNRGKNQWRDLPNTPARGAVMATTAQKKAARRNLEKARDVQSARAHGAKIPRSDEGLSTAEESQLADREFAFPKERKEPLSDAKHVRNAIARFDQVEGVSDAERDEAWKRILAAAKRYDVDVSASSWRELFKGGKADKR